MHYVKLCLTLAPKDLGAVALSNKPLRGAEGDNPCCREGLLDKEYDRMQQGVTFKQQVYIQDMLAKVMRKLGIPRRSSRSGACTRKRETHAKLAVSSKGGVDSSPALSACGRSRRFFFRLFGAGH